MLRCLCSHRENIQTRILEKMYLPLAQRNSENETENDFDRTDIRKICQETNSCSVFTHAEIIGLTFGGLGPVIKVV